MTKGAKEPEESNWAQLWAQLSRDLRSGGKKLTNALMSIIFVRKALFFIVNLLFALILIERKGSTLLSAICLTFGWHSFTPLFNSQPNLSSLACYAFAQYSNIFQYIQYISMYFDFFRSHSVHEYSGDGMPALAVATVEHRLHNSSLECRAVPLLLPLWATA